MSSVAQYRCTNPQRRELLRAGSVLNGIDYLEVDTNQTRLIVHFVHDLPGGGGADPVPADPAAALTADHVRIEGGVRVRDVNVVAVAAAYDRLTVDVDVAGDFSNYRLIVARSHQDTEPPQGFDPQLSQIAFSFKVDCPNEFDCRSRQVCSTGDVEEPVLDYLAKDYASFRRLMLDRLSALMPAWRERNPADLQIALIEILAYVGDHLSYFQDAVGTEAYLGTARRRTSVRRHARLLDYVMHEGKNARAWICFEVDPSVGATGLPLDAGARIVTKGPKDDAALPPAEFDDLDAAGGLIVFETAHAVTLQHAHSEIGFYTWGDGDCCLPKGATRATLRYEPGRPPSLAVGDVLIFEECKDPATGKESDADQAKRHAVRLTEVRSEAASGDPLTDPLTDVPIVEIEWAPADALPFTLCLSATVDSGGTPQAITDVSVARGNVVAADHGRKVVEGLVPRIVPDSGRYTPLLAHGPLTRSIPFPSTGPATDAMHTDARLAGPAVVLSGEWEPRGDLLESTAFSRHFVVETKSDGTARLRFGDGVFGLRPIPGMQFTATYRIGNGRTGNVGADALTRIVSDDTRILRVRNPMPAWGGQDPEPLEQVRLFAPQAFRTQQRAVTADDYATMAQRHHDVQKAAATLRWTGSWHTAFVTVDRVGGAAVDPDFETEMRRHLEPFRMAGYDLEIDSPVFVPLEIVLDVCVEPRYFRSDVRRALLEVFSSYALPDGRRGFFHPDGFTFGQPVYLSQLYEVAMQVDGVSFVEITRFKRWGKSDNGELDEGVLRAGRLEVVRLDNDPNFPENGWIDFQMKGGL